jgi:type VI secretion system protein ImpF
VKAAAIDGHDHNKLIFEIEADLWAQPYPERLYLKTELDLGNDVVFVTENNVRSNV